MERIEKQLIYLQRGRNTLKVNLEDDEVSLQVALGYMDYQNGLLPDDEIQNLSELALMKHTNFFASTDEYLHLYGVDGALRRFRQSSMGKPVESPRRGPTLVPKDHRMGEKIHGPNKIIHLFTKRDFLKIS